MSVAMDSANSGTMEYARHGSRITDEPVAENSTQLSGKQQTEDEANLEDHALSPSSQRRLSALLENISSVVVERDSMREKMSMQEEELQQMHQQLMDLRAQLDSKSQDNVKQKPGEDRPRSRPLTSNSRSSIGQSRSQASRIEMSTHSLLDRCSSVASQRSLESRLESSIDDIDEALSFIQSNRGNPDKAVGSLLKMTRQQVREALDEVRTITTHDDNIEKQYKETVIINSQLERDLARCRREMRHLRGKLSISELTPFAVRQEKARQRERLATRQRTNRELQRSRGKTEVELVPAVMNATQRSQTVNVHGEYFNSSQMLASGRQSRRSRMSLQSSHRRSVSEPLPPPLVGCRCSVCRSVQSLGATTISHVKRDMLARVTSRHAQQLSLGDRVTLQGGKTGMVKYIGRLHSEEAGLTIFIGLHLDAPVGRHNGTLDGRRYYSCPPSHGLFVTVTDITAIGGTPVGMVGNLSRSLSTGAVSRFSRQSYGYSKTQQKLDSLQLHKKNMIPSFPAGFESAGLSETWPPKQSPQKVKVTGEQSRKSQTVQTVLLPEPLSRQPSNISAMTRSFQSEPLRPVPESQVDEEIEAYKKTAPDDNVADEQLEALSERLSTLIEVGRREEARIRASQVLNAVDYYTVEEFFSDLFPLADPEKTGTIDAVDCVALLTSQALCLALNDSEVEELLKKVKKMQDGQIPYSAVVPHLGIMLQEIKAEGGTTSGPSDWTCFFSKGVNCVVFWNVRTAVVTTETPDELDVEGLVASMDRDVDMESVLEEVILRTFQRKDLGSSGFLTPQEFVQALQHPDICVKLTPAEAEQVLFRCGADLNTSLGIPYLNHTTAIRQIIAQVQSESHPEGDYWCELYSRHSGLFYLNQHDGCVQYKRPQHQLPY